MNAQVLIDSIVRQVTVLIAQLATSGGIRAPLSHVANQVFLDLARELEGQGLSRKVSADMFGLGLRTYRRKIQRMTESATERGRSLWEVVLEHIRQHGLVTRLELLTRLSSDEEAQVRAVLRDLCESQLIFSSGVGASTSYRAATDDELASLKRKHGAEGSDEMLLALLFREAPLTALEVAQKAQTELPEVEAALARLVEGDRLDQLQADGQESRYRARQLVIPLGAPVGWEAAVFDHFKALVTTVLTRLRDDKTASLGDVIGGSTYTIDVWPGHPLAEEVYGALGRMRASLSDLRARVLAFNAEREVPEQHNRVVIYVGQCLFEEGADRVD